jgi:hypothetical protein
MVQHIRLRRSQLDCAEQRLRFAFVGSVPPMAFPIPLFYLYVVVGSALFFQVPIPLDVHHVDLWSLPTTYAPRRGAIHSRPNSGALSSSHMRGDDNLFDSMPRPSVCQIFEYYCIGVIPRIEILKTRITKSTLVHRKGVTARRYIECLYTSLSNHITTVLDAVGTSKFGWLPFKLPTTSLK